MADTPEFLAERLRSEGQRTLEFYRAIAPGQWGLVVYTESTHWTVLQVLAHFVSTESAILRLMKDILAGGPGSPEGFNIDSFNERKVAELREVDSQELIAKFSLLRQQSVELVSGMLQADLSRTGRHPYLGMTDMAEIIKLLYRHNQIHQRDVRKVFV